MPKYHVFLSGLWVEDEGLYVCEAHNHFGKIETQATIRVTGLGGCNLYLCNFKSLIID